jgi:hypothetical protein
MKHVENIIMSPEVRPWQKFRICRKQGEEQIKIVLFFGILNLGPGESIIYTIK